MTGFPRFVLCASVLLIALPAFLFSKGPNGNRRSHQVQTGLASFYDEDFEGKRTASGKRFDPDTLVAAHPHYPVGTMVRVTNLENGRSIKVRIIDRGPSRQNRSEGVVIDLSRRAAEKLAFKKDGRARVRIRVLKWGSGQTSVTGTQ